MRERVTTSSQAGLSSNPRASGLLPGGENPRPSPVVTGWDHPARGRSRRRPAGAGPLRTGGSQAEEGQNGFARAKSAPHAFGRAARAASARAGSRPAHRLG